MGTQTRLTTFAMTGATWATWMLVGLSEGGLAVAIERAFYLIADTNPVRKLRADFTSLLCRNHVPAHDVSTPLL